MAVRPRTVLLVPGAWHGAWAWERVLAALALRTVPACAVHLPGRAAAGGGDGRPPGDLHDDAAAVTAVLDRLAEDGRRGGVVLVGHSYAGAVVTEAGEHPAVERLVYLAGFPLAEDESCAHAAVGEAADLDHAGRPDLGAGLVRVQDGVVEMRPDVAADCFYSDCDPETVAWALPRLAPHRLAALQQHPRSVAWRSRPSTYVVCSEDLGVHPQLQRVLSRRCTATEEWPTGHSPFLSRPELVADLLQRLAVEPGPR